MKTQCHLKFDSSKLSFYCGPMTAINQNTCCFCGSTHVTLLYSNSPHKFKKSHGRFDFYKCKDCGSGLTLPIPSPEILNELYASYNSGLPELHRDIMSQDPQTHLYSQWCGKLAHLMGEKGKEPFTWIEVGAGGGELASLVGRRFPQAQGLAVDLHTRPSSLDGFSNISWQQVNLNDEDFSLKAPLLGKTADLVYATAVWEHVLRPDVFVGNLMRLLKPHGILYLVCPNYGSIASHVLKKHWPYFQPGEHLNMPTIGGAKKCLVGELKKIKDTEKAQITVRPLPLPYTIGYVFARLGLTGTEHGPLMSKFLSASFPMPAGALEATLILDKQ